MSRGRSIPASVGMSQELMYEMYRLLAIAKYEARYVIPTAYAADGHRLEETVTECSLDFDGGPGMYGSGPFGEASGQPVPVAVETFQALRSGRPGRAAGVGGSRDSRVNLLNWDGKGSPPGMFTPRPGSPRAGPPQHGRQAPEAPAVRMKPRRGRHRRVVWQAASLLLAYPDDGQPDRLDLVESAAVDSLPDERSSARCWPAPSTCAACR